MGGDDQRRVADDGADKFFFGDLFDVGEAKLGEEFLVVRQLGLEAGGRGRIERGGGAVGGNV